MNESMSSIVVVGSFILYFDISITITWYNSTDFCVECEQNAKNLREKHFHFFLSVFAQFSKSRELSYCLVPSKIQFVAFETLCMVPQIDGTGDSLHDTYLTICNRYKARLTYSVDRITQFDAILFEYCFCRFAHFNICFSWPFLCNKCWLHRIDI